MTEKHRRNEPKRHHYVPKFYLRGFADRKRRIRVYARAGTQECHVTSVGNAAVESGLYTSLDEAGRESQVVEVALAKAESAAKLALDRLTSGSFPPTDADREDISVYLALQLMRTPHHRRQFEVMADTAAKALLEGTSSSEFLADADRFRIVPPRNLYLQIMMDNAVTLAPVIAKRSWIIFRSRAGGFVTSDHPLVWYGRPKGMSEFEGIGLGNAMEAYFPLSRTQALALAPPGAMPEMHMDANRDNVLFVNWLVSQFAYKWMYQHPEDEKLVDLIPVDPRPILVVNGTPVFDDA